MLAGLGVASLEPPSPLERDPYAYSGSSSTEQELARADREDSGRGLEFFWLNVEGGGQYVGLQTFDANQLVNAELTKTTRMGPVYGVGAGLRLFVLTLGGRFRLGQFQEWDLWTLNGELGLHVPIGIVEPYFTLGGGYASIGAFDQSKLSDTLDTDDLDIWGWNVRGGLGVDVYLTPVVSVGGNFTGDLLILTRGSIEVPQADPNDPNATAAEVYARDGSSIGGSATLTAVVGLHF